MATATTAKAAARNSQRSSQRRNAPKDYWKAPTNPPSIGRELFRVRALRGHGQPQLDISDTVTSFDWDDSTSLLSGTMTLTTPPQTFNVFENDEVLVEYDSSGIGSSYAVLFRMRISDVVKNVADGSWDLQLEDDLALLQASKDDWNFRKDKAHPHGWTADQILRYVCKRYHVPLGTHVRCSHKIARLRGRMSPFDVIVRAYRAERTATGRRFVVSMRTGKLTALALTRSRVLLDLSDVIVDAQLHLRRRAGFATAATVRAETGKHKKRKIVASVKRQKAVDRYGYVHIILTPANIDSVADARSYGLRRLATVSDPIKELTLSSPLVPTLKRGDAIKVELEDEGVSQIVFVTEHRASVSPGNATSEITVQFDDPYVEADKERATKLRCQAAQKRNRKAPKGCPAEKRPAPAKAKQRQNS